MSKSAEIWLESAEKDLRAAQVLASDEFLANVAVFHGQQCVEKSLKALVEAAGGEVPRTHSIQRLHKIVLDLYSCPPLLDENEIDFLDSVYIDSRYPSSFGFLPSGTPTATDAEHCVEIAKEVHDRARRLLKTLPGWET